MEPGCSDAQDGVCVASQPNRPADNSGIGGESSAPEIVAENDHRCSGRTGVAGFEELACEWLCGEHVEVVVRHELAAGPDRRVVATIARRAAERLFHADESRQIEAVPKTIAQRRVVGVRQHLESRRRRAAVVDGDQRLLTVERERPPERLIDEAECDRADSHGHAERQHGDGGRGAALQEEAPGDADVLIHALGPIGVVTARPFRAVVARAEARARLRPTVTL